MRRESLLPFAAARSDSELQEALYSEARQQRSDAALQLVLIAAFVTRSLSSTQPGPWLRSTTPPLHQRLS